MNTPELCLVLKMQIIQHLDLESFETLNILNERSKFFISAVVVSVPPSGKT